MQKSLIESISKIITSGQYTNSTPEGGYWVQKFEKSLSDYLKKPTIVVNSGTTALILSLKMAGINENSLVCIPAYGFIATKNAVLERGARCVYADVKEDCLINTDTITWLRYPDALIVTDLYGEIADIPKFDGPVIEDACQALGTIRDIRADYTCFSFYPTKIVNAGEGGAITFQTEREAKRARKLRTYPDGINLRMSEINACIGWHNMQDFKGGKPKNWYKHYDYTLSPKGLCPVADRLAKNKLK